MKACHYIPNKLLDKIKKIIAFEKFDNTKIFIDINDELPNYFTLKNAMIVITFAIKDYAKFYLQPFLEKAV